MRYKAVVLLGFTVIVFLLLSTAPAGTASTTKQESTATSTGVPTGLVSRTATRGSTTTTPTGRTVRGATRTPTSRASGTRTTGTPTSTATPASPTATTVPADRFFPETGFNVPGVFVKYWSSQGGLPVFGFPISEARLEHSLTDGNDYLVQYFERNRFEYHPEFADTPNEVLLGLLGAELTKFRTFPTVQVFEDSPGRVYMAPTGHSLGEPFLSYWRNNGGLGIFGYPISEPFDEVNADNSKTYLVQYFQRNRFEFHPENKQPYDVLLGLLGRDFAFYQQAINAWGTPVPGAPTPVDPIMMPAKPYVGDKFLKGPTVGDGMIVQAYYQDRERILNMLNDLNFKWVKQQVEWKDTENPKGVYHWEEIDRVVNAALAHNLKVLITVVKAPTWATSGGNGLPNDPQDFGDFMAALTFHFKGKVSAYELWNEENLVGETGDVNPGRIVELFKWGYKGVKQSDRNAIVVSGALSPTGVDDPNGVGALSDTRFLEMLYQYHDGEVRRYFDALGSHPYGFNNPPDTKWPDNPNYALPVPTTTAFPHPNYYNLHDSFYFRRIEEQRAIMEKYGDGQKQMWVTEYGWCSDFREDGYGECKFTTPDQQADYIVGAIQRSRKFYPWMGVMFLWNLNFSTFQEWYTGPSHFSILNPDWTGRPAYFALRNRTP
ncbi:MAG: hypothetical protein ACJ78Q_09755 [Chloroflexia bacterium]